jgi:hypothetical protein
MITDAFEGFAHSLRILLEAVYRSQELLMVDAHEAAGNIEQGLTNALNAYHSVYDSALAHGIKFDWYGTPETATLLAIRNARHHNSANRIRGLYTYHLQQKTPENWKPYVIVDYPTTEDGGDTFDLPISWYDLKTLLNLPSGESRLRSSARESILDYLVAEKMDSYAAEQGVEEEAVFINVTPLMVNAARKFVPAVRPHLKPRSMESKIYSQLFENVMAADTHSHVVDKISIFLPS